jgi:anti-anti-sigma factor
MEIKSVGDLEIAVIPKRFDAYGAQDVEATFKDLIGKGARRVICDFSQTEYVASAGLRVLLGTAKNLQKQEGILVLCSLRSYVKEVFDTAGFTQIFKIYASTEEAIESLQKK